MWILWLTITWAGCKAGAEHTAPGNDTVSPDQPILASSPWGTPEHLAKRLRLRGPDGKLVRVDRETLGRDVRLVPHDPLALGTYVVEERGDYDAAGQRLYDPRADVHHDGWFAAWEVEVVAPREGPEPAVQWFLSDLQPTVPKTPLLAAEVVPGTDTSWLELEVRGVGAIDVVPVYARQTVRLDSYAHLPCNDYGERMRLGEGDVTVRVTAHGPGWTAASPWTSIGPTETPSDHDFAIPVPASPPTGEPANVSRLQRWAPIRGRVSQAPTETMPSTCGRLTRVGTELLQRTDDEPRFFTSTADGWQLGGRPVEVSPEDAWALEHMDGAAHTVGVEPGEKLLALGDRTVRVIGHRLAVDDSSGTSPAIPLHLNKVAVADGEELVLAGRVIVDGERQTQVERYACSGEPLGVPERWSTGGD